MKLKVYLIICLSFLFSFASVEVDDDEMEIVTQSGFETEADIYIPDSKKTKDKKVFIVLHGKGSKPTASHLTSLYDDLEDEGYKVITPTMAWSKNWNGTFPQGLEVLDEIIKYIHSNGNQAILVGHSLGGASSLIYSTQKREEGLLGVVVIAPGHMIHKSKKILNITEKSVMKARKRVQDGEGDDKLSLKEVNTGKIRDIRMRADVYLSFYDREVFPNVEDNLENITYPILWIAGKKDRLTTVYDMPTLFEYAENNDKSQYTEVKGGHKSVVKNSTDTILKWIDNL